MELKARVNPGGTGRVRYARYALAAILLAAAAARADSLLDRPAPEPVVAKWVVGEAPPAWKALKGRCALLELTDPEDLVSQGLASRTAEIAARGAAKKLLAVSVAVGAGADEATAKAFARTFKVTWALGVDRKGETFLAAGMPSLPRHFLVAPDGRVLWEGSPGDLDDRMLDRFLEQARLWRPEEVAKAVRPAADLFVRGKYGASARRVEEALAEVAKRKGAGLPLEGTEERDGQVVLDGVKSMAVLRLGIAERFAKDRWSLEALETLEGVASAFGGTEWEGKAREGLARIAEDRRAEAEILAMRRLREILGKIRPFTRQTVQHALSQIDAYLIANGNLVSGERARKEQGRLRRLLEGL